MTLKELRNAIDRTNKGLSYKMYKQALLNGLAFCGKLPESPEDANAELYLFRKRYKMSEWVAKRYYEKKGVKIDNG